MDPITASAVLSLVNWEKVLRGLADQGAANGAKALLKRLMPAEREKAARVAIALFVEEFLAELDDKTTFKTALLGYRDQLMRLIEAAAPEITSWLEAETNEVDLGPVTRMWDGLQLDPLPTDFDWTLVAKNYARSIRKHVKADPALRARLDTTLLEQQTEAIARIAGPAHAFDLTKLSRVPEKEVCDAAAFGYAHQHL
jgi:hypothetical protein